VDSISDAHLSVLRVIQRNMIRAEMYAAKVARYRAYNWSGPGTFAEFAANWSDDLLKERDERAAMGWRV
jgi:hypothetical protein